MRGVTVCAEANFPSGETLETTQQRVVSGFPWLPDLQRSLTGIYVACPFHTVFTVNFMTPMDAIAADQTIKARTDRFGRGNGFDQNPHLDHVARFPVVGGGFETSGDDHAQGVFMKDKSVAHREPPIK
jgi:hypothetical protein